MRQLDRQGYANVLTRTSGELDLRNQAAVEAFFADEKPAGVILAAARVGGIQANSSYPADFIRDNLSIQSNVIDSAYRHQVSKLVFLGSSCIYPRLAPQPMKEEHLLSGPLEPTNEWYAVAKIAGIKLCQAYRRQYGFDAISLMPTNLYGPGDNFDLANSHVLPALIRKFHEARERGDGEVQIWGSGTPKREFLHADDLADAVVFLMNHYADEQIINVGVGRDVSILELAQTVQAVTGFKGDLVLDPSKPDGTPRKLLDVSRLHALGWEAKINLRDGIASTYQWFINHLDELRA